MKQFYTIVFSLITILTFAQDRVNASLPVIDAVANGRITEATGWLQNDAGKWTSRKNKIPANMEEEYKTLIDFQHHGLGENRENFIYIEHRNVKIADSSYTILIKKYKDGFYKYESINQGWMPQNSLVYYVFKTSELDKLKNLEPNKAHTIRINTIYSNTILYLDPKSSLKTVAQNLYKELGDKDKFGKAELEIHFNLYKGNVRFTIQNHEDYPLTDFEKAYYETPLINFEKLFKLQ
ncbi:hypothetical protein GR160_08845 [Flavobacterium sp. Sd200]|uniref:hypothetical protein n=1 Tax=Flavobacterium sp. Sd200 TaxID=2692211 RepID=UPI001371080B|nr:hypothetical protein [Flavobacterium sp. Sd200]MXN91335.1 hypothetical protein [Flavobacterium sp. Sd200]